MARRQHILVLCVAALLLTAGCSADDASDAAAAAAQAAATPDIPQTSTNIAQADADGVTVAQQSNREKAAIAAAGRGGAKVKKAAAGPSPAAAAQKEDAAAPAPPVSGKEPANFPGMVVATPGTPQTAAANSIPAVFPGGTSTSAGQAKRAAAGTSNVAAAASPADAAASPESAAAAPSGEDAKKRHKKKHKKKKIAGTVEGAAAPAGADGAEDDVNGGDMNNAASPAASLGGGATVATPAQMPTHAAAASHTAAVATPAAAVAQKPVSASASAEAKPVGASAVAGAKTESNPVAAAATPAAATHGASATANGASAEAVATATPAASVAAAKPAATTGAAGATAAGPTASAVAKPGHAPDQAAAEGTTSAAATPDTAALAKPGHAPGQAGASISAQAATPDTSALAKPGHAPGQAAAEGITNAAAGPDTSALARPGHAPGTAAATPANSASAATEAAADAKARPAAMQVSQVRTNFEATEPEGTMYDGQGNVVQAGVPVEGPIPAHAGTNPNAQAGQVATTDVSDRSALALDRAAVIARQGTLAPAPAPSAQAAAVSSAGALRTLLQATGGATNFGSAAQSVLSGLANSLSGSQQAAVTQGAGVNAQSLGSTVQQATPAASTQQLPQQASAAGSADPNSGVVSGNTFQSSGQTSPLTPYNTAMDNSIGNMGKQLGSLIHKDGQGGTNLQQTPTIDPANSFQQPQLPANREIVHLNIPQPNLGSAGTALGRRLQDAAGELSPPQQMGNGAQSYGATTPPAGNMLQATVGKLQNAAYAIANTLQGATIANKAQPAAAATAGMQASSGAQASSVPQWSTDPSLEQPAGASSAAGQQGASSGSAQPMAASVYNPSAASSAAGQQDAGSGSTQPMAAAVPAASATSLMPWTTAATGQLPLSASMQDVTSANAVADGMQRAVQNAQNIQTAQSVDSATSMAAPQQQQAAAPALTSAATMAAPVQQQAAGATTGRAVTLSSNAGPVQPPQQQSHTSTSSAPMTKIGSSETQPMSASSGNAGGGGLINGGTPTSEQQSLGGATGMLVGMMNAGRKLLQAYESLMGTVAATVAKDAKVQDTAGEVVAAAAKASGAYWTAARSDTAAAQTVITLAANDPTTIAATEKLEGAIIAAVKANYASAVPTSIALAASSLNIAELLQFPQVQGQAISLLQAAAAATGASWDAVAQGKSAAAQSVVAKSVADPTTLAAAEKLIEVVLSQSAIQGSGKSLGDLFSRRHLLDAQNTDGSLQSIVHNAVNDPSAQAAFAHVMEAAATETKAISQISGPSTAPAPGSISGKDALSALVASVSHNTLASALPGKPPSSQQQFNDWEGSLSSPSAQQEKAAAAAQDGHAVQGFDAAALGKELAQQVPALAQTVDQAASSVLLGIGRRHLSQDQSAQAQQSVDLTPAVEDLQQLGSELGAEGQEAGQAAGNAVGLTPARLASAGAQLQEGTHAALIDAAKDVVRTIGVDSDYPNFQTPGSQYGYNPVAAVIPYSGSIATAPAPIFSATATNTAAVQQAAPIADTASAGRKLQADETQAQAQAQTQAQAQAQANQDTANAAKNLIAGVSSLASLFRTALAPAGAATPANAMPTMQQQSAVPQTQALASSVAAQPLASQQAVDSSTNLQSQYSASGATSGAGGGHVGISQATTFAGENGNQLPSNDIHLDGSKSNFVIGPDGKVPSLASQGGAAAVAQQEGLLVPNGAAGSQSTSPSPVGYGSGYGSGSTPGYGTTPTYGMSSPSYGSGYGAANSPPAYGYGSNSAPAYGSTTGTTPSYGSTTGSNTYSSTPAYGASSSSSVPGTVTAYNQGQAYGSTQQSNTSGSTVQSNNSGPSVQGSTAPYAATVPSLQYQPTYQPQQQGMAQASFQRAVAPAPVQG